VSTVVLAEESLELGEGSRVDDQLVLVDILAGRLLTHGGRLGTWFRAQATLTVPIGAVAAVTGRPGHWIAAAGSGIAQRDPAGRPTWLAQQEERADGATRMNDGVADAAGRVWTGSMAYDGSSRLGSLRRADNDGSVQHVWDGLAIANGPAFSVDGATMYVFDTEAGELDEPVELWRGAPAEGSPDGLAVDDQCHGWVALWGGVEVRRLAPDGSTATRVTATARPARSYGG
jgi:sugar lactone lactonase YvrE